MRKMKRNLNVIRLLVLVFVLLAWYINAQAQCYQNEEINNEKAAEVYERFCTGFWLFGTFHDQNVTIFYDSRPRELHICGLSDEMHNLCAHLYDITITEDGRKLVISGESQSYINIYRLEFVEKADHVHVQAYNKKNTLIYESKNFKWYSY